MEINPSLGKAALSRMAGHKYVSGNRSFIDDYTYQFYLYLSHYIPKVFSTLFLYYLV